MSTIPMPRSPSRHRITVEEYHRMAEVGLLAPDARVELIAPVDGCYTDVSATSTPGVIELPGLGGKTVDLSRLLRP
jgi:hypothetical protein